MRVIGARSVAIICLLLLIGAIALGAPPRALNSINDVRDMALARRNASVRVHGVVIQEPGRLPGDPRFFYVQDRSGGIAVVPSERLELRLGVCVDVEGRAVTFNELEPQIEAVLVEKSSQPCSPLRLRTLTPAEASAGRYAGDLVKVIGRIADSSAGDDRALILLGGAEPPLRVYLRRPGAALAEMRQKAAVGAEVQVTGIPVPAPDGKTFNLRLRQPSDLLVRSLPALQPNRTMERLVGFAGVIGLATLIWIILLRRAVARKTREVGRLLREAQAASQMKSQFLANMSHEIRTPIHGILGMQEIVLQSGLQPLQRESLEIAHSATRSLLSLLNDILDLSKIEAQGIHITPETMDLPGLMTELERLYQSRAHLSGVEFRVELDPGVPKYVLADTLRLRQVLTNLLSNAFKFTAEGAVTMKCSLVSSLDGPKGEPAARILFSVVDSGIGIPAEEVERVFSAFHQADGSITRRFGGTGLGLTIASQLVALMNGDLKCDSTEGVGSAFSFELELPVAKTPGAAVEPGEAQAEPPQTLRILLAEDNAINQLVVSRPMEALGHSVVICEDGRRAAQLCAEQQFDIVLMDVQMPVLDGLEATRLIRLAESAQHRPRVPILALTANSLREQVAACFEAGMDACLCKPFLPADLLNLIAVHARRPRTGASSERH
jgi:signal transduction histidine kinase/CheY-like chemotaxis protein